MSRPLFPLILFLTSPLVWAQVDSSALLLRSGSNPSSDRQALDSGRYKVRPEKSPSVRAPEPKVREEAPPAEKIKDFPEPSTSSTPSQEVAPAESPAVDENAKGTGAGVRDFILGGDTETISIYRSFLNEQDIRRNLVEIELVPLYIYNESKSNYWYRNYRSDALGYQVAASAWLTPFFGLRTSFMTSLAADIKDNPDGSSRALISHQWFDIGLRFRRFFTMSKKSSYMVIGIDFDEYDFSVPPDNLYRIRTRSLGAKLSVETHMPTSGDYEWLVGAAIVPSINHSELGTGVQAESGDRDRSNRLEATLGGTFNLSRTGRLFWNLSHSVEKNVFSGTATTTDPATGQKPSGVSVTNSFTILKFGYIIGF